MARPRKKPGYDAEKVRNDFFQEVAEYYKESSKVSLRDVAAEFDITLLKVRKVLITAGVYATDTSEQVHESNGVRPHKERINLLKLPTLKSGFAP